MDRFDDEYRVWATTTQPARVDLPAPTHRSGRAAEVVLVACVGAFLLDTFAPWQRICMNFASRFFSFDGCLSANAWSGSGSTIGVVAGVCAILAALVVVLQMAGALDRDSTDWLERVLVWGVVGAGGVKWLLVIDKAASVGAWVGVLLLFGLAAVETIRART